MKRTLFYTKGLLGLIVFVTIFTACGRTAETDTPTPPEVKTSTQAATAAEVSPTPSVSATEEPLAARVNDEGITLAEYETELALFQLASGLEPTPEDRQRVLTSLIEQTLLAQAADLGGYTVDEATLQNRLEALEASLGSEAALAQWIDDHGYTTTTFQDSLAKAIAAAWMRDQITSEVPLNAEQVHARQILVYDSLVVQEILAQLQAGNDFGNLANQYDPITGGDLGWFPRGYLPSTDLESAAFDLQPGQYSQVIQTVAGFHILQVTERDPQHPLSPDALLALQNLALQDWLAENQEKSDIQILVH
jgi:peptidyl-prolyl cis-trans isomerase C